MKNKLFATVVLCFSMFIAATCEYDLTEKTATFYIHNDSQYLVTDIFVPSSSEGGFREILESGENCTLLSEWVDSGGPDGKSVGTRINFYQNGEEWGCVGELELATADPRKFKQGRWVTDGEIVTVHIYDDHWEWWTVE